MSVGDYGHWTGLVVDEFVVGDERGLCMCLGEGVSCHELRGGFMRVVKWISLFC